MIKAVRNFRDRVHDEAAEMGEMQSELLGEIAIMQVRQEGL